MTPEQRAKRLFPDEWTIDNALRVHRVARAIRAAENAALERAAKTAATPNGSTRYETASAIRSLKSRAPKRRTSR